MTQFVNSCPKFLALLAEFYPQLDEELPLDAMLIPPHDVPEPQRTLLVHQGDMTSTLAKYHRDEIVLRELERHLSGRRLTRHIVLQSHRAGRPVEYGASRIHLAVLGEQVCRMVLAGHEPLGGILNTHGVKYTSCPGGFYRVRANELMQRTLQLDQPQWLYGRCNCLRDLTGQTIAEVVEILPPENHHCD
jgi:hypothetical protein